MAYKPKRDFVSVTLQGEHCRAGPGSFVCLRIFGERPTGRAATAAAQAMGDQANSLHDAVGVFRVARVVLMPQCACWLLEVAGAQHPAIGNSS